MQKVVTSTTVTSNSPYSARESASSISIPARVQSNGTLAWTHTSEIRRLSNEIAQEKHWSLSPTQDSPIELSSSFSFRPTSLLSVQKPSPMPPRTSISENPALHAELNRPERHVTAPNNNHRWRFNETGQLVDAAAASEWELAQDIARLNLGSVTDLREDVHGPIKTPPQSRLGVTAVVPYNEASPLETASEASLDSSPQGSDHQLSPSHSRVSSTDTLDSHESALSSASQTLRGPPQLKAAANGEAKERPHSFSGGLSSAELRRLKQVGEEPLGTFQPGDAAVPSHQWSSSHYRDLLGQGDKPDQPTYPSLAGTGVRGQQQYGYRAASGPHAGEAEGDFAAGPRSYFPHAPGIPGASQQFVQGRPQRGFPPHSLLHNGLGYTAGHVPHLSLGTAQQLYDMVHMDNHHPAVTRVQQQHNAFRATHQHSASDPSALRDAAALALLSGQGFPPAAPNLYPTIPPHLPLYYPTPDGYGPDVAAAVSRLQAQFGATYATLPNQTIGTTNTGGSNAGSQTCGPSANNRKLGLYKTELCRSWEEKGSCRYGTKCQFAHGEEELRAVARHPKYKTEICRTFWVSGACPYGKRCCFIHTELPVSGIAPGADGAPPPPATTTGRERSNSDPNETSISLLQRIQRKNEATPVETSPPGGLLNGRPPTGSLRVDTTALSNVTKQNKSAYPTFTSNALMLSQPEQTSMKSPVPMTAGPDFGRHNASRLDIVGYNQRVNKTSSNNCSTRHSFDGADLDLDLASPSTPSAPNQVNSFTMANERASTNNAMPRSSHIRSGSTGNWGNVTRSSNLTGAPTYPYSETNGDTSWSTSELTVGNGRISSEGWM